MAADLITTVPSQTQLTINNQTQGSLARTEDLRSIYRASPNVPLSQSSPHHASCHLMCSWILQSSTSDRGIVNTKISSSVFRSKSVIWGSLQLIPNPVQVIKFWLWSAPAVWALHGSAPHIHWPLTFDWELLNNNWSHERMVAMAWRSVVDCLETEKILETVCLREIIAEI